MTKVYKVLGLMLFVSLYSASWAQFRTVTVQNAPANPVPTAAQGTTLVGGSVNISNMPTVNVNGTVPVNGSVNAAVTGNVGIVGSPAVNALSSNAPATIINGQTITPVIVRNMDEPARHPFQQTLSCSSPGGAVGCSAPFGVSPKDEVVIEYINLVTSGTNASSVIDQLGTTVNGSNQIYSFPPGQQTGGSNGPTLVYSSPVKIYADPNTPIWVYGLLNSPGPGTFNLKIVLSGYTVTLP